MDDQGSRIPSSNKMSLTNHTEWFTAIAEEVIIDNNEEDVQIYPDIKLEPETQSMNLESENSEDTSESQFESVDCIINCETNEEYICEMDTDTGKPNFRKTRQSRSKQPSVLMNETQEEREARLARMSAYATQRLANETPEQRAKRLKRMSEYASKRLRTETSEQRAKRLARMSAYAAKRLAAESPEQRKARLARMSEYAAKKQSGKKNVRKNSKSVVYIE